jgi:hypothetical protein
MAIETTQDLIDSIPSLHMVNTVLAPPPADSSLAARKRIIDEAINGMFAARAIGQSRYESPWYIVPKVDIDWVLNVLVSKGYSAYSTSFLNVMYSIIMHF